MPRERRAHPRQDLPGVVTYRGSADVRCLDVRNASLGGLRIALSGPERPGERVELRITLVGVDQPLDLVGRVVWARQAEPFEAGVRFVELDAEQRQILQGFLD